MTAKESGTSKLLEQSPLGLQAVASGDLISLIVGVERRNWWACGGNRTYKSKPTGKQHWSADSGIDVGGYRSGRS